MSLITEYQNFAEGGEVEAMDMAMDAGIGGMMKEGMNDKELISSAIDVQGEIEDEDQQKLYYHSLWQFGQAPYKMMQKCNQAKYRLYQEGMVW